MTPAIQELTPDAAARRRIRESLGESLIVEASAGTGKTTEMVRRIVAVLESGYARIGQIAAVTFTHKAAGELKLRLRQGLDRRRAETTDADAKANLENALTRLEEASIGTIHSFCAQILRERPVEAVVDPAFEEVSTLEGERLVDRAFRGWFEHQLNQSSPGLRRCLCRMAWRDSWDTSPPMSQLKWEARKLIEWRDFPAEWQHRPFDREAEIDALAERVGGAAAAMSSAFRPVHELHQWIERAESVRQRDYDTLESLLLKLLRDMRQIKRKGAEGLIGQLEDFKRRADADLAVCLRDEMWGVIDRYERLKHASGQLDFLDLLILARDLVRSNGEVRAYLQERFTHIFVDEFQDTDPLQAELIMLLAADDPAETNWLRATPKPGKLFVVGDPKQSIYKFRRADVTLYQSIRARLETRGVGVVQLTRSFRSIRPIQQCVNSAFETEMTGDVLSGQAFYSPLEENAPAFSEQPAVVALPVPKPYGTWRVTNQAINESLPDTCAAYIEWLVKSSGWQVRDPERPEQLIPLGARHIAILFRRFTNFGTDLTRDYTRNLEARGIPHLLVGSKSFHSREEVETMRGALTAVEWPGDELAVFATLKGALFAIPDSLLLRFRHEHGSLNPFKPLPEDLSDDYKDIAFALNVLAELHKGRNYRPVAETVNTLLETARAHAGFALRPAGHQVLANVYRVADLARTFETEGGISFRGFVEMLVAQVEKAESSEAPVLEEGADGVRLMTVHAAKGLEFPVVLIADITAKIASAHPDRYVNPETGVCATQLMRCAPWELIDNQIVEQARERAEGVRVAYVAATRARDLLIVPVIGDESGGEALERWTSPLNQALFPRRADRRRAMLAPACPEFGGITVFNRPLDMESEDEASVQPGMHLPQRGEHTVVWWDPSMLTLGVDADPGGMQPEILAAGSSESMDRYKAWSAAREEALLDGRLQKYDVFTPTDGRELPESFDCSIAVEYLPKAKDRPYGPRFGTMVHAILRDVPFDADREEVARIASLHARIAGAQEADTQAAIEAAVAVLGHWLIAAARSAQRCHRELPLTLPLGNRVLEGVIDLAYLDNGAWTIVDFKTDAAAPGRLERYKTQLRWYAYALHKITGNPVRGWLLSA